MWARERFTAALISATVGRMGTPRGVGCMKISATPEKTDLAQGAQHGPVVEGSAEARQLAQLDRIVHSSRTALAVLLQVDEGQVGGAQMADERRDLSRPAVQLVGSERHSEPGRAVEVGEAAQGVGMTEQLTIPVEGRDQHIAQPERGGRRRRSAAPRKGERGADGGTQHVPTGDLLASAHPPAAHPPPSPAVDPRCPPCRRHRVRRQRPAGPTRRHRPPARGAHGRRGTRPFVGSPARRPRRSPTPWLCPNLILPGQAQVRRPIILGQGLEHGTL